MFACSVQIISYIVDEQSKFQMFTLFKPQIAKLNVCQFIR